MTPDSSPPSLGSTGLVEVRRFVAPTLLFFLVCLTYLPVLHAGFIWDDNVLLTDNPVHRSFDGLRRMWFDLSRPGHMVIPQYYPLTHTSFWIEYHLWQYNPLGYHIDNVLLHAAATLLLYRILVKLNLPAPWLATACWALHPVLVESVAWITERKNTLSACFYFTSFLAYLRFTPQSFSAKDLPSPHPRRWYFLALFLYALALLAKTAILTFPAVLLLLIWWKQGRFHRRDFLCVVPFFLLSLLAAAITSYAELISAGAIGQDWQHTPAQRLLIAGHALFSYATKLLFPSDLAFSYAKWSLDTHALLPWLYPAGVLLFIALLFTFRRRLGRGPITALLFFAGTLLPVLGFVNVYMMRYSFVGDHLQYIPSLSIIILVIAAFSRLAPPSVLIPIPLFLACLSFHRAHVFQNSQALWRDTLAKNPGSWLAHTSLEKYYSSIGDPAQALAEIQSAISIRPNDPLLISREAMDLATLGRFNDAFRQHLRAISLDPHDATLLFNYAHDLAASGNTTAAESVYRHALEVDPGVFAVRINLGLLLAARGDAAAASTLYEDELKLNPYSIPALNNLAASQVRARQLDDAAKTLHRLLDLDPQNAKAHNTLALILARTGNLPAAEQELREAISADPNLPESHNTLGGVLAMQNRLDAAIAEYRIALRLRPDFPEAQRNLTAALASQH